MIDTGRAQYWMPILSARPKKEKALKLIRIIMAELEEVGPVTDPSLAGGLAGRAILYGYLDRAGLYPGGRVRAVHCIQQAMEMAVSGGCGPTFFRGFVGIAWVLEHLRALGVWEEEGSDSNVMIDKLLLHFLSQKRERIPCEIVAGWVGYGIYALSRVSSPEGGRILNSVVDGLGDFAIRVGGGLAWHTAAEALPPWKREFTPRGCQDLGMAHGLGGIVAFLSLAASLGVDKANGLLEGAVHWLMEQKAPEASGYCYPKVVADGYGPFPSDLAWCYGDLGISVALFQAARWSRREAWREESLRVAVSAAARSYDLPEIRVAGLCHGSIGNAHLFNRLYQYTKNTIFMNAAHFWYEKTLDIFLDKEGMDNYSLRKLDDSGCPYWDYEVIGLLEGTVGIALALLAGISPIEPAWDRMLLIS